jgi:hypothetical protein
MKNILSRKTTAIILLVITILSLGFYAYMIARPISYGMGYHNETAYEGGTFDGTMKFYSDTTMLNSNSNLGAELESRYDYKDGYVFFVLAGTEQGYEAEVAFINEHFEEAIARPFYADKINAFRLVAAEADGFTTVYTCTPAIVFAIVGGVVEIALVALTCATVLLWKRKRADGEDC